MSGTGELLANCPFCGVGLEDRRAFSYPVGGPHWQHPDTECIARVMMFADEPRFRELWNRRAPPAGDVGEAAVAGLAKRLHEIGADLNTTDQELLRIRNDCEGKDRVTIWSRMLQMIVDYARDMRKAAPEAASTLTRLSADNAALVGERDGLRKALGHGDLDADAENYALSKQIEVLTQALHDIALGPDDISGAAYPTADAMRQIARKALGG